MAGTSGIVNATLYKVTVGGTSVECQINGEITFTQELRETTSKDSGGWAEFLGSKKMWEGSFSSRFKGNGDSSYGFSDVYDLLSGGSSAAFEFGTGVTGDLKYTGNVFIQSLKFGGEFEQNTEFDCSFRGTAAPTKTTES